MIITNTNSTQVFDAILRTSQIYSPSELSISLLKEGSDVPYIFVATGIIYNANSVEITYDVDISLLDNEMYLLTLNDSSDKLLFRDKMQVIDRYNDDTQDDRFIIEEDDYSFITTDSQENFVIVGDASNQGGDKHFSHIQSSSSAIWTINHSLGKFASVMVVDSANTVVQGAIDYIDANNIRLTFSSAFSGRAYFN